MNIMHFGNVANVSYLLAYGLERYYKCETYLVMSPKPRSYSEPYYGYDSGNPYKINILYALGSPSDQFRCILPLVLKEKIDIVHFHSVTSLTTDLFARIGRCKVIRHFHGSDLRHMPRRQHRLLRFLGEERVLVSTPDLLRYVWTRAIHHAEWFPNPVDPAFFENGVEAEDEKTVFLPTRHDESIKKTSVAFAAWRLLKKLNPDAKLKAIMIGPDAQSFHRLFESDKRITWLPTMTKQEYARQLKSSAVIWGQFALGILSQTELEAMAAGKPIITDFKRRPQHFDPPVAPYYTPQSIAHITDLYLRDGNARKKLGTELQKWCLSHHGLETVTSHLYEIYRQLT